MHDWMQPGWVATPVGSRVTCSPPPTDTDEDFLCLVPRKSTAIAALAAIGFKTEGSPEFYTGNDNGGFLSLRRGETNLILTESEEFHDLFLTASDLAKRFNLLRKQDRIALFQAVLYGVKYWNIEEAA